MRLKQNYLHPGLFGFVLHCSWNLKLRSVALLARPIEKSVQLIDGKSILTWSTTLWPINLKWPMAGQGHKPLTGNHYTLWLKKTKDTSTFTKRIQKDKCLVPGPSWGSRGKKPSSKSREESRQGDWSARRRGRSQPGSVWNRFDGERCEMECPEVDADWWLLVFIWSCSASNTRAWC